MRHLATLAAEMRLGRDEVFEVATFCADFDMVREEEAPPAPLTVRVCEHRIGDAGSKRGAYRGSCV